MAVLITSGQETQCIRVVEDAARKAAEQVLSKLRVSGDLTQVAAQRVLVGGDKVQMAVRDAVRTAIAELVTFAVGVLKCISVGQKITIVPTDGTETLAEANDVFNWIDPDFQSWGASAKTGPTPEASVEVCELAKDANFQQIFGSFGQNLDRLCLTENQIKRFVLDHSAWLHPRGWATFFLYKVGSEYFVASVHRGAGGYRRVFVSRLSDDCVWRAEYRDRVVVPQLIL